MGNSVVSFIVFVLVFGGMLLIHELGHYLAARLFKVDIDEFGFGLPPRLLRFWRLKGSLVIGRHTIEIPRNFELPREWNSLMNRGVDARVERVGEKFVLRSFSLAATEDGQYRAPLQEQAVQADGSVVISGILREVRPGTEFTLNWIPLGGFVRPKGDNDPTVPGGLAAANPWVRLAVLGAGPAMNLIAGVLVYSLIFNQMGIPDVSKVEVFSVSPDSPASQAGLLAGDTVLTAGGEEVTSIDQLRQKIRSSLDSPLELVCDRDGERVTLVVTPLSSRSPEQGALGVSLGHPILAPRSWFDTIPISLAVTGDYIHTMLTLPGRLASGLVPAEEARFVGLKGIYDFISQAVTRDTESRQQVGSDSVPSGSAEQPTNYTLGLVASLTISLGLFNLLPLPALDGGRILFILPELIFRRRVSPRVENVVHGIGLMLLLLFMFYINVMDFLNPISVNLP